MDENTLPPLDLNAPAPQLQDGKPGLAVDIYYQSDRLNMMMKLAKQFHEAKCFTSDVKNAAQALVKIQAGAEMGMGPAESMASLYLVNGKVTIFGSGMTKKLREHGWSIKVLEETESVCHVQIQKGEEKYDYKATFEEVNQISKQAIKFARKDKMFWHAVARLIRRYVPEVLGGSVMYYKEEIDMSASVQEVEKPETEGAVGAPQSGIPAGEGATGSVGSSGTISVEPSKPVEKSFAPAPIEL